MTLKRQTMAVVAIALMVAVIAIACGESTENVIATQQAINRAENTATAAAKTVEAGGDPNAGDGLTTGQGSIASIQATNTAATSTALVGATATTVPTVVVIDVPEGPTLTDADNPTVQIGDQGKFTPEVIKVQVGTTVTWENPRRSASSTASQEGEAEEWNSNAMSRGTFSTEPARFSHTFTIPGCHKYESRFSGDTGTGAVCVVE